MNFFSLFKRKLIYQFKKKINLDQINLENNNLDFLFEKFETDKANRFQNNIGHGYSKYYEKYLNHLKEKKIRILEIGSYSGASAAAFVKYFPLAEIFCIDVNISNFKYISKQIKLFGMNVSDLNHIKKFKKKNNLYLEHNLFDIIIDDASHKLEDILFVLENFNSFLKTNGFYIIEDCLFPNIYQHLDKLHETKIDELIGFIKNKQDIPSKILSEKTKKVLLNEISFAVIEKGHLSNSDICFLKKK